MKNWIATLLFCILTIYAVIGQTSGRNSTVNLVPNAGFEEFSGFPIGWFYKGKHFTSVVKYWSAATAASPDVFGPKVRVPLHWQEKDFGKQEPKEGNAMAGITVYGCDEGKPHCREYLQIQLLEPLVVGQNYYVEFWCNHLPRSLQVNNIGCYFSDSKQEVVTDEQLKFSPQINAKGIIDAANGNWVKVAGRFKAETVADYLIVGNFFPDSLTHAKMTSEASFKYAYYYIDAIKVLKEEPILPVPEQEPDLSKIEIEAGKVIQLKHIFFETDMAELLPRSYIELKKLLQLLEDHPTMAIEVRGHTDIRGGHAYNIDLSHRRSKAVVDYLTMHGVAPERVQFKGFGSSKPIATNDTSDGRQQNRRVEFIILRE